MGLLCEFDVVADFGFIDATEEYGIIPDYSEGCEIFIDAFLKYSHQLVPVDTGYLRSTLEAGGGDTSCYAKTDCDYAQYVEYGTSYMESQPYFTPAIEMALMEAEPAWREAEQRAFEEEQELMEAEQQLERALLKSPEMGMMRGSPGGGPQAFGGINFSSPMAFIGSMLGTLFAAFIITTVQAIMGKDFRASYSKPRLGVGEGYVFVPDVIIT